MLLPLLRRSAVPALCVAAVLAGTTACQGSAAGSPPTWVPQPNYQGNIDPRPQLPGPALPAPSQSPGGTGSVPGPGGTGSVPGPGGTGSVPSPGPSRSGSAAPAVDPSVVATKLNQPTGLVVLPDGTALVGERTTGRILRVQPEPGHPAVPVQRLAVDGSGDGGLLDLAISPTFDQDGLVYAYLSTATDNRVVHFALGSPPSAIVTGIPKGRTGNAGRLAFDATGALLIGTGDAGRPALAGSVDSLAGKILRTSDIGRPMSDNPVPGSRVFAYGLRTVDGLCVDARTGLRIAVSAGSGSNLGADPDEVNVISPGDDYGWPDNGPDALDPVRTLPPATSGGGGCALAAGKLLVATSAGRSLAVGTVTQSAGGGASVGAFDATLRDTYGRLATVVAAPDGALWLTTRNRDGHGKPTADDDRVIRISPSDTAASSIT